MINKLATYETMIKYLSVLNKSEIATEGYVTYILCTHIATGFKFIHCKYNDSNIHKLVGQGTKVKVKFNIKREIGGIPVISIRNFFNELINPKNFHKRKYSIVLDFSGSDLSNIIDAHGFAMFESLGGGYENIDIILPTDKDKKLQPVDVSSMLRYRDIRNVEEIVKSIDFNIVNVASYMLYGNRLELFDFDWCNFETLRYGVEMFAYCGRLKEVRGKLRIRTQIKTNAMFFGCKMLEYIEDNLFDNITIRSCTSMYFKCEKLETLGIGDNTLFYAKGKLKCDQMTSYCNNICKKDMERLVMKLIQYEHDGSIMRGYFGDLFIGLENFKCRAYRGILRGNGLKVVDFSGAEFTEEKPECALELIGSTRLDELNHEDAPDILLISENIPINNKDREFFMIIDMRGYSSYDINAKITLSKAFRQKDDSILMIVDKGWINN